MIYEFHPKYYCIIYIYIYIYTYNKIMIFNYFDIIEINNPDYILNRLI